MAYEVGEFYRHSWFPDISRKWFEFWEILPNLSEQDWGSRAETWDPLLSALERGLVLHRPRRPVGNLLRRLRAAWTTGPTLGSASTSSFPSEKGSALDFMGNQVLRRTIRTIRDQATYILNISISWNLNRAANGLMLWRNPQKRNFKIWPIGRNDSSLLCVNSWNSENRDTSSDAWHVIKTNSTLLSMKRDKNPRWLLCWKKNRRQLDKIGLLVYFKIQIAFLRNIEWADKLCFFLRKDIPRRAAQRRHCAFCPNQIDGTACN